MNALSIIVPIYNEENSVYFTIESIKNYLADVSFDYEIIAVNDGSSDQSYEQLQKINDIVLINHKINKGYGASLKTGLRNAKYDHVCITDADGTYPNDRIPDLFETYSKSHLDMLVGSRTGLNVKYPFIKKVPKYFIIKT